MARKITVEGEANNGKLVMAELESSHGKINPDIVILMQALGTVYVGPGLTVVCQENLNTRIIDFTKNLTLLPAGASVFVSSLSVQNGF